MATTKSTHDAALFLINANNVGLAKLQHRGVRMTLFRMHGMPMAAHELHMQSLLVQSMKSWQLTRNCAH